MRPPVAITRPARLSEALGRGSVPTPTIARKPVAITRPVRLSETLGRDSVPVHGNAASVAITRPARLSETLTRDSAGKTRQCGRMCVIPWSRYRGPRRTTARERVIPSRGAPTLKTESR